MRTHIEAFSAFNESRSSSSGESSWYYGIADCHGIESFIKEPDLKRAENMDKLKALGLSDKGGEEEPEKKGYGGNLGMMMMRCKFNSQRHPVVYRVKLSDDAASTVEEMFADGDYADALIFMKDYAEETQIARGQGTNPEKTWKMIPNPDLDPFH
jgi:hypothetical protein